MNAARAKVSAAAPAPEQLAVLPGADFADCFRIAAPLGLTAPQAAEQLFAHTPAWVRHLMALRDRAMAPFGLVPAAGKPFPIISSDPAQVVMGLDDRHLDFRLVVSVEGQWAAVTTVVRTRNLGGRLYLAAILPFHRLIARAMVARLAHS